MNGGLCVNAVNAYSCVCASGSGFTGPICSQTESSIFSIANVAGGVAAAVGFVVLSIVCYFKCCKKDVKKAADFGTVAQPPVNDYNNNMNNAPVNPYNAPVNPYNAPINGTPASLGVI